MTPATQAAVDVASQLGIDGREPVLLQETNNTVVWLRPEPVVAKVATRPDAMAGVRLEHAIASELVGLGAEIAAPVPGTSPSTHRSTGYVVTLWEHLTTVPGTEPSGAELAASLQGFHRALARTHVELPSFRVSLSRAREALDDDARMAALPDNERRFLRSVNADGMAKLDRHHIEPHRLHGEPHEGNRLATAAGLRWIDFESCCVGPLEWDLAFLPPDALTAFPEVDLELFALLRLLNSARVATWCLAQARFPEMRRHGEVHLALVHGWADEPHGPTTHLSGR
jgi:Ser/Thr protein kinase RdoA (MazF antagonist)